VLVCVEVEEQEEQKELEEEEQATEGSCEKEREWEAVREQVQRRQMLRTGKQSRFCLH
jgi:hypothetical protein